MSKVEVLHETAKIQERKRGKDRGNEKELKTGREGDRRKPGNTFRETIGGEIIVLELRF